MKSAFVVLFWIGTSAVLSAQNSVPLFLHLSSLTDAVAPTIVENTILLTYAGNSTVRSVAVAFAHENFRQRYTMQRNESGVFLLRYPIADLTDATVGYRYVVDGVWRHDPANPRFERQPNGALISVVSLPPRSAPIKGPSIRNDGAVEFLFQPVISRGLFDADGSRISVDPESPVYLAGSFNGWNPFLQRLMPGEQSDRMSSGAGRSLQLRLAPGTHYYYFVIDGRRVLDPHNDDIRTDRQGRRVSTIVVP